MYLYAEIKPGTGSTDGYDVALCCGECGSHLLALKTEYRSDNEDDRPGQVTLTRINHATHRHYATQHPDREDDE